VDLPPQIDYRHSIILSLIINNMNQSNPQTQLNTIDPAPLERESAPTAKWSKLSLKTKVTLLATILGLAPIAAIGALSYSQINNALTSQIAQSQKARAQAVADKFNRFVFERNGDVEALASQPIFADAKLFAITSTESKAKLLDRYVDIYQVYDSIAAFDLKGNPIAQSKGGTLGNHLDRKYFQEVLKTGKTVISEPEISKGNSKLAVYFAAPIKDATTGQIVAIMRTRAPIDRLEVPLKDLATKTQNYHILDTRSNVVFISSNNEYAGKSPDADIKAAQNAQGLVSHQGKSSKEIFSAAGLPKMEGMQ
jgi:methyl-accepting chemotaxis protein PixJ